MARRRLFYSYFYIEYAGNTYGETVSVSPFNNTGGTDTIIIASSRSWSVISKPEWATLSVESGSKGKTTMTITVAQNEGTEQKNGDIIIKTDNEQYTATVSLQQNASAYLSIVPSTVSIGTTATTQLNAYFHDDGSSTEVTTSATWSIISGGNYGSVVATGANAGSFKGNNNTLNVQNVTVQASYNGKTATAVVTVGAGSQNYRNFRVSPSSSAITVGGGFNFEVFVDEYINDVKKTSWSVTHTVQYEYDSNLLTLQTGDTSSFSKCTSVYDPTKYYPQDVHTSFTAKHYRYGTAVCNVTILKENRLEHQLELTPTSVSLNSTGNQTFILTYKDVLDGIVTGTTDVSTNSNVVWNLVDNDNIATLNGNVLTVNNTSTEQKTLTLSATYEGITSNVVTITVSPASITYRFVVRNADNETSILYNGTSNFNGIYYTIINGVSDTGVTIDPEYIHWEIVSGSEYGTIYNVGEEESAGFFHGNNTTASDQTVVVQGTYNGLTDTEQIIIQAKPSEVTHEFIIRNTSGLSTLSHNGSVTYEGVYYTITDDVKDAGTIIPASNISFEIVSGNEYASINSLGVLSANNMSTTNQTVVVKGTYNSLSDTDELTVERYPEVIEHELVVYLNEGATGSSISHQSTNHVMKARFYTTVDGTTDDGVLVSTDANCNWYLTYSTTALTINNTDDKGRLTSNNNTNSPVINYAYATYVYDGVTYTSNQYRIEVYRKSQNLTYDIYFANSAGTKLDSLSLDYNESVQNIRILADIRDNGEFVETRDITSEISDIGIEYGSEGEYTANFNTTDGTATINNSLNITYQNNKFNFSNVINRYANNEIYRINAPYEYATEDAYLTVEIYVDNGIIDSYLTVEPTVVTMGYGNDQEFTPYLTVKYNNDVIVNHQAVNIDNCTFTPSDGTILVNDDSIYPNKFRNGNETGIEATETLTVVYNGSSDKYPSTIKPSGISTVTLDYYVEPLEQHELTFSVTPPDSNYEIRVDNEIFDETQEHYFTKDEQISWEVSAPHFVTQTGTFTMPNDNAIITVNLVRSEYPVYFLVDYVTGLAPTGVTITDNTPGGGNTVVQTNLETPVRLGFYPSGYTFDPIRITAQNHGPITNDISLSDENYFEYVEVNDGTHTVENFPEVPGYYSNIRIALNPTVAYSAITININTVNIMAPQTLVIDTYFSAFTLGSYYSGTTTIKGQLVPSGTSKQYNYTMYAVDTGSLYLNATYDDPDAKMHDVINVKSGTTLLYSSATLNDVNTYLATPRTPAELDNLTIEFVNNDTSLQYVYFTENTENTHAPVMGGTAYLNWHGLTSKPIEESSSPSDTRVYFPHSIKQYSDVTDQIMITGDYISRGSYLNAHLLIKDAADSITLFDEDLKNVTISGDSSVLPLTQISYNNLLHSRWTLTQIPNNG